MSRRAAKALEILLEKGTVTTGDLSNAGYDHPPRAVRDLRDAGISLATEMVVIDGRRMAQYSLTEIIGAGANRKPIPKALRDQVIIDADNRCAVCGGYFKGRYLQADHRIPFAVGGDPDPFDETAFMALCSSDNRAKSRSCEQCPNWEYHDLSLCSTCYWHDPDNYSHVATKMERRFEVEIQGDDVRLYDRWAEQAEMRGLTPQQQFIADLFLRD